MATGKQPGVIIIARHGPRLDAADQSWHLSTPTPYDPPLTYGGWNQCRSLGIRIAKLLHAREQAAEDAASEPGKSDGVTAYDFAQRQQQQGGQQREDNGANPRKRKRKHKVVIHTSPFLRCVQSSVAIAAGMAQYQPPSSSQPDSRSNTSSRSRTPSSLHSVSPRLRGTEGLGSPTLAPISEPRQDLAHAIARRVLSEHRRHGRFKLRVDAFLGEWLNPQYFDQITPPPPSAMMVATAKAELKGHEMVDIFAPSLSTKSSGGDLWGAQTRSGSRDDALEDWNDVHDSLVVPVPKRDRASSASSVGSNDSGASGRKSPFRPGHVLQPFTSTVPKPETSVYVPPTPHYAVSSSDHIPRGYVSHARQACVNADYAWDSSRPPQGWGDGGEYGEEWSGMHKRFRRGLNHLVHWYSQHNADDRAEDALGLEQAEHHRGHDGEDEGEEEEELVLILVTHGAGSNALIGALTGQPVLLDVGMASLTLAVRRDDAPLDITPRRRVSAQKGLGDGYQARRRTSLDMGLSAVYEMKLVSSSEHLMRPSSSSSSSSREQQRGGAGGSHHHHHFLRSSGGEGNNGLAGRARTGTVNSSLGSMRRPSGAVGVGVAAAAAPLKLGGVARSNTLPVAVGGGRDLNGGPGGKGVGAQGSPVLGSGLWMPAVPRTPAVKAEGEGGDEGLVGAGKVDMLPGLDTATITGTASAASAANGSGMAVKDAAATAPASRPQRHGEETTLAPNGGLDGSSSDSRSHSHSHSSPPPLRSEQLNGDTGQVTHGSPAQQSPPLNGHAFPPRAGLWGAKPGNAGQRVARMFGR
ncbi:hypothetical protein B0A55_01210 [Friedmanniomyces simplex]|uniref:Phosphoglycerate mutase n=1 Tax=Friedmanniomyces simplex TaxID=329884 RepID=A0A4U0XX85_9PEZI|nr:hypothetical protein B0A55_01210 [Friedmanniomyces simplex]